MARTPRKVEHINSHGRITEYPWKEGGKALAKARGWSLDGAVVFLADGASVPDGEGGWFVMLQRLWV